MMLRPKLLCDVLAGSSVGVILSESISDDQIENFECLLESLTDLQRQVSELFFGM